MSIKNVLITISIVLLLLLSSLIGYYFIINSNSVDSNITKKGIRGFLPFGGNDNVTEPQSTSTSPVVSTEPELKPDTNFNKKLRKITSEQVAGAGTLDIKAGTIIRYIEKATGHIYEVEMFSPRQSRISNTTIPVVYDAMWGNNGNSLMARYLKDDNRTVDTYSINIKNTSTTTENIIDGILFPKNTDDVSVYGNSVFYLIKDSASTLGFISSFDGSKPKQIWNSPLKEISSQFVNDKYVSITTKPYQNIAGFMYLIDTKTGKYLKVLGDIVGLSGLVSPDAKNIIYINQNERIGMYVYNQKSNRSAKIIPSTFPEKCVWSKKREGVAYCAVPKETLSGNSLTNWYLGRVTYNDDIWIYDTVKQVAFLVSNISSESGEKIDVIKPVLSDNEQYLVFMNKKDNTLWSLDLLQTSND